MSAISKALDEIKFRIPYPVLLEAFKEQNYSWRNNEISIDESILNKVIRPRVIMDVDITGGIETYVPLYNIRPDIINNYMYVFNVPKDYTQGRSIISALSITYFNSITAPSTSGGIGSSCSANDLNMAGMSVMNSFSSIPLISNAQVRLIAENTVMVTDSNFMIQNSYLRCILSVDEALSHLQPRSWLEFSKLCELAVKSYIYNTLLIKIDTAKLVGGQDLGVFRNIVESYSDSEQMYQDYLREKWQAVSFLNDAEAVTRHIKMMINPAL